MGRGFVGTFVAMALVMGIGPVRADGDGSPISIVSATWVPSAGTSVTLVDGGVVAIDTAVAGGKVVVEATSPTPVMLADVVVAFALEYRPGIFWREHERRIFELDAGFASVVPDGPGTRIVAEIPMLTSHALRADDAGVQSLRVWIGRPGVIDIRPTAGVRDADAATRYGFRTSLPEISLIPDLLSVPVGRRVGISAAGPVRLTLFRRDPSPTPESFALAFSGPPGVRDALAPLPTSITIPAEATSATVFLEFDLHKTTRWPGEPSEIVVEAAGVVLAAAAVLHFSEATDVPVSTPPPPTPPGGGPLNRDNERCARTTSVTVGPLAPAVPGPCIAGAAVLAAAAAGGFSGPGAVLAVLQSIGACPTTFPNGANLLSSTSYMCEEALTQVCSLVQTTFTLSNARSVVLTFLPCSITPIIGWTIVLFPPGGLGPQIVPTFGPTVFGVSCNYSQVPAPTGTYPVTLWDCR